MQLSFSQAQKQELKLSPQMIQSMSLFGLSTVELRDFILNAIDENPALELKKDPLESSYFEKREKLSIKSSSNSDTLQNFLENQADEKKSLQSHLLSQLGLIILAKKEKDFCEKLIQNLNEYGFCIETPENLFFDPAIKKIPSLTPEQKNILEKSLETVKNLEPNGCASKNLQEYLLFQAKNKNADPLTLFLLEKHFKFFENPRASSIKKELANLEGTNPYKTSSLRDIEASLAFIKHLQPYPTHNSEFKQAEYIIPEIFIEHEKDSQKITAHIVNKQLPIAEISQDFIDLKQNSTNDLSDFIKTQLTYAHWLLNSLSMRSQILYKIAHALIVFQKDFFIQGQKYLKPLRLKDVAQSLDLHETTISRISNGKFLQCDWGIFEIKYFFSSSTSQKNKTQKNDSKNEISRDAIKEHIKEIIDEFKKNDSKISDEKIAYILREKGISIARRTVAKYRMEL
ncbi:MAG: RNA polymerase factor sigma-54 [Treponemataceae bacterium]